MCALVGLYLKFETSVSMFRLSCHFKMKPDMEKLTTYSPVVNTVDTYCDIKKVCILPIQHIYVFRMILLEVPITSLNNINQLVLIIDTDCVVCEVGTEFE
jgi:hypothetical protein